MDVPSCEGCRRLQAELEQTRAELEQTRAELAELRQQLRELQARLKQDATNSSLPPSANPLHGRKLAKKKKSKRRRGGQPGHAAHLRKRLPSERVNEVVPFVPTTCDGCGGRLPNEAGPNDPEPTWHQYVRLPPLAAHVTEYQGHARTCACCGEVTRASIPEEIRKRTFDPGMTAAISYFVGRLHVSRRDTEEAVETFFQVPIALGTVSNLEQEMSAALAPAHAEAQQAVQEAAVKNIDETGWKEAGQKRWLWAGATKTVACYVINVGRGLPGLLALLGHKMKGILCSDRWSVYGCWKTELRQVCWAHLKRDFQKLIDRGGVSKEYGKLGHAAVDILFHEWHLYRGGNSRAQLQRELEPVREMVREWLEEGTRCRDRKTATFCQNLLDLEPALWTFLYRKGVEPTNNHGERIVRTAVLWRKNSFGCQSQAGCRFVERILTAVQTLRMQQRPVFAYLAEAIAAHRTGSPIPQLLK
jgi:transposase